MTNGVTPDEVDRRQREHEARSDRQHAEIDSRVTKVASDSVAVLVWQQAERARDQQVLRLEQEHAARATQLATEHAADLAKLRQDVIEPLAKRIDTLEKRPALTVGRMAVIATAVIALAALVVQAWGTLKGAAK